MMMVMMMVTAMVMMMMMMTMTMMMVVVVDQQRFWNLNLVVQYLDYNEYLYPGGDQGWYDLIHYH